MLKKSRYPYLDDEIISALHKCIRAGDIARSCYFAKIIKENIGVWRIKQYLFFIILEETINIDLYNQGLKLFLKEDNEITDNDLYKFIYSFCTCDKKWDTEDGQKITLLNSETDLQFRKDIVNNVKRFDKITNIERLIYWQEKIKEYDVSYNQKSKTHKKTYLYGIPELFYHLETAVENKNTEDLLYLSYLFFYNKDYIPFELLGQFFIEENKYIFNSLNKLEGKYSYVFNYIVAFYSMINSFDKGTYKEPDIDYINKVEYRLNKALKERRFLEVPLYALDEHTKRGKDNFVFLQIIYNKPLNQPVDLRYAGRWYGVLWRIASIRNHNRIMDNWEDVIVPNEFIMLWHEHCQVNKRYRDVKLSKIKYIEK